MSVLMRQRSLLSDHFNVKCACGKTLRARYEHVGSDIYCWSCKAPVEVPVPRAPGGWVARVLRGSVREVLEARTLTFLVLGSTLVTGAMMIPGNGCWSAAVALTFVLLGYGELVRRGSSPDWANRPRLSASARLWRLGLCAIAALVMISPWLMARGLSTNESPRMTRLGVASGLILASGLPLLMLGTFAKDGRGRGRLRLVRATLIRHPVAVLAALALVPLMVVVLEGLLYATTRYEGVFSFMVLDLFPKAATVHPYYGIPFYGLADYRDFPESVYIGMYVERLRQGYTFVTALPASIAIQTKNGFDPLGMLMSDIRYLGVRAVCTLMVVMSVLAVLAVQARWLGLLSSIDSRRAATRV